ncbi:MAG: helix-turn-helix domain-containing protein [Oscillospiraceae bacterium]|nr:helix-turn-helix domain-containing protein [Oscillospiraceae bacterium]
MEQKKRSQCNQVLRYIEEHGSITPLEAFEDLGIMRLSARIKDLRDLGYLIRTTTEHYFHDGVYKHYARYSLKK